MPAAANDEPPAVPAGEKVSTMWVHTWFGNFNVTPGKKK